jgi:hypothetical protein
LKRGSGHLKKWTFVRGIIPDFLVDIAFVFNLFSEVCDQRPLKSRTPCRAAHGYGDLMPSNRLLFRHGQLQVLPVCHSLPPESSVPSLLDLLGRTAG